MWWDQDMSDTASASDAVGPASLLPNRTHHTGYPGRAPSDFLRLEQAGAFVDRRFPKTVFRSTTVRVSRRARSCAPPAGPRNQP